MHIRCSVGGDALGDNAGMVLDLKCLLPTETSSTRTTMEVAGRESRGDRATFGTVLSSGKDALIFSSAENESSTHVSNLMVRAFVIEAKKKVAFLLHPPRPGNPRTPPLEPSIAHHIPVSTTNLQVPSVSRTSAGIYHGSVSPSSMNKQQQHANKHDNDIVVAKEKDGVMHRASINSTAPGYDLYTKLPPAVYNDNTLQTSDRADRQRRYLQQKREAGLQHTNNLNHTLPLHVREAVMSRILKTAYTEAIPHGQVNPPQNFILENKVETNVAPEHASKPPLDEGDVSPPPRERVIELYSASIPRDEKLSRPKHFMTALSRWNKNSALFRSEKVLLPSTFQPTPFTVLLGHKREFRLSSGNKHLKSLCESYRERYDREDREGKSDVVSTILTTVYNKCPVGAFVKEIHGKYYEVEDLLARDKIAADLRKLLPGKYRSVPKRKGSTPSSDDDTNTMRVSSPETEGDKTKSEPGSPLSTTATNSKH
eukprot:Nitzschia sp. Nitz4//scaffold45_size130396//128140//129588//NITZ4_003477-RA/size130396-processed-gene-0.118-mRNA-1//-1//CDS//3329552482//1575//frame0